MANLYDYMTSRLVEDEVSLTNAKQLYAEAQAKIEALEATVANLKDSIEKIGYSINQIDERTYELVKNEESAPI